MAAGDDHPARAQARDHDDLGGAGPGDAQAPRRAGETGISGEPGGVGARVGGGDPAQCSHTEGLLDDGGLPGEHLRQDRVVLARDTGVRLEARLRADGGP